MTDDLHDLYLESLYFEACVLFAESLRARSEADMQRLAEEHQEVVRLWRAELPAGGWLPISFPA